MDGAFNEGKRIVEEGFTQGRVISPSNRQWSVFMDEPEDVTSLPDIQEQSSMKFLDGLSMKIFVYMEYTQIQKLPNSNITVSKCLEREI